MYITSKSESVVSEYINKEKDLGKNLAVEEIFDTECRKVRSKIFSAKILLYKLGLF